MRKNYIALFIAFLFLLLFSADSSTLETTTALRDYYISSFYADTGAINAVTGIYLNYRLFDTMFESLLLLVSVIGIIHFSRYQSDS